MNLLHAKKKDLEKIMGIIKDAQELLANQNIDQWQNGYPNTAIVLKDIQNNQSYVVKSERGDVTATAMFSTENEPTYSKIKGNWIRPGQIKYGVIHRMAVAKNFRGKGIAKFIFNACEQMLLNMQIPSMRIDTHKDNFGMQKLLKTMGYSYCGVIYLENGDKRLAFEKLIH